MTTTKKHGMLIGYARVSTSEQNVNLQEDALKAASCEKIFTDKASGAKSDRPGLMEAMDFVRKGDTLVVWKLDRLGRSIRHLIDTIQSLHDRGVGFKSLQESIDTTTSGGKLVFHIFSALAEFERDLIRERTKAGLEAARSRGRRGGRPEKLTDKKKQIVLSMSENPKHSVDDICSAVGISRATYYRYLGKKTG